jgi:hypothetical protein
MSPYRLSNFAASITAWRSFTLISWVVLVFIVWPSSGCSVLSTSLS